MNTPAAAAIAAPPKAKKAEGEVVALLDGTVSVFESMADLLATRHFLLQEQP